MTDHTQYMSSTVGRNDANDIVSTRWKLQSGLRCHVSLLQNSVCNVTAALVGLVDGSSWDRTRRTKTKQCYCYGSITNGSTMLVNDVIEREIFRSETESFVFKSLGINHQNKNTRHAFVIRQSSPSLLHCSGRSLSTLSTLCQWRIHCSSNDI